MPPRGRGQVQVRSQARRLYVEDSKTAAEVARLVGVSAQTVSAWAKRFGWAAQRETFHGGARSLYEMAYGVLRAKLEELRSLPAEKITPGMIDALAKLVRNVERLRTEVRLFECCVIAAEQFVPFVQKEIPDEATRAEVFAAWEAFLESVKE